MKSQESRQGMGKGPKANVRDSLVVVSMEEPTPPAPPGLRAGARSGRHLQPRLPFEFTFRLCGLIVPSIFLPTGSRGLAGTICAAREEPGRGDKRGRLGLSGPVSRPSCSDDWDPAEAVSRHINEVGFCVSRTFKDVFH